MQMPEDYVLIYMARNVNCILLFSGISYSKGNNVISLGWY